MSLKPNTHLSVDINKKILDIYIKQLIKNVTFITAPKEHFYLEHTNKKPQKKAYHKQIFTKSF